MRLVHGVLRGHGVGGVGSEQFFWNARGGKFGEIGVRAIFQWAGSPGDGRQNQDEQRYQSSFIKDKKMGSEQKIF